jgi:hypothetical protein
MQIAKEEPEVKANQLLRFILEHQPNLMMPVNPHATTGAEVAAFISSLRQGLIQMYSKTPGG